MDTSEKLEELTHEDVKRQFSFDPLTGNLIWKVKISHNNDMFGKVAGTLSHGYLLIRSRAKQYLAHRLVWLYVYGVWPKHEIDHINGHKADNRIENLRECTQGQNTQNRHVLQKNNTSGHPGVCLNKQRQKWMARITVNRKTINLGLYPTKEEAIEARISAKKKYHTFHSIEP